jgi:CPA1 family monovalent cation:H+ antiporter
MENVALLELILLLLALSVGLALVARALRVPPAVVFVPGGMILALTPGVPAFMLDPALSMTLFLPPLIQSGAFFTVWRDFRANLRPILLLAVGAVAFTTLVVGWTVKLLEPSLPWAACFTLGAIVSPPDAVAAAAVLERLRLPRRLQTVLEGESLVNDAAGLVLYRFAAAAALGGVFDAWHAAASFALVAAGGIGIGYLSGLLLVWGLRRLHDTNLEITTSFLASYASYILAERLEVSGVLATVACGLVLGWRQHETFTPETRQEARAAWRFVTFVLEAIVFVLIGLSLRGVLGRLGWAHTLPLLPLAAAVTLATVAARFVWVFPATYLPRLLWPPLRRRDPYPPLKQPLVLAWCGMRGVVSLAVALALPEGFPGRDPILVVTFGVILGTVMLQGPTLGPLIQALKVGRTRAEDDTAAEHAARAAAAEAALRLMETRAQDPLMGDMAADLLPEYRSHAGRAQRSAAGAGKRAEREAHLSLRLAANAAARQEVLRRHRASDIHDEVLRKLEHELDLEELRVRRQLGGD